ncbi:S49 family peptidase [Aliarcobacter lanthieri]|uniref:S49 family peptidase n=1 Tax=Aliarcobacter lanthieri TaxID=1355374 RepID=UPI003AAF922B
MNNLKSAMGMYPWAIVESEMDKIIQIVSRSNEIEALQAKKAGLLGNTHKTYIRDGVAIIPIYGSIFRYANLFTEISGATSTQMLALDFNSALTNPDVKAIILDVDSGGGQANGISEISQMIFNARGIKPIKAYVGGSGASAAYWIASSADEVIINETGIAGSIGAMLSFDDDKEKREKEGIKEMKYISSVSPLKNSNTELQALVDSLGQIFVENVARNRGVDTENVLSNFGKGGLFVGKDAVKQGLADRVGTFEEVLSSLKTSNQNNGSARLKAQERQINLLKMEL